MNKLKVFTAFSGYDSQCMALDRLGIDYELVGWSEIDKYAIKAHNAVYPQYSDRNFGDISKIDWDSVADFDLFTYSFPCQDISKSGCRKGLKEGSGTKSSLLWECKRAIESKFPKYLVMENVKSLSSKTFKPYLNQWTEYLKSLGYSCFTKVLNAKDFGIPQNRQRTFMISILGNETFIFPKGFHLSKSIGDILDEKVDEKYYVKDITNNLFTNLLSEDCTIKTKAIGYTRDKNGKIKSRHFMDWSNTIHTVTGRGGDTDCFIAVPQIGDIPVKYRIRRLTSTECFRLMGVLNSDIVLIQKSGISHTQQLKLAGNSIVVDVLYYIFKNLFFEKDENETSQLSLF